MLKAGGVSMNHLQCPSETEESEPWTPSQSRRASHVDVKDFTSELVEKGACTSVSAMEGCDHASLLDNLGPNS